MKEHSNLYKKHLYLNKSIVYLFSRKIIEYDMKEAGYSLIKEYQLLPKKYMNKLKEQTKDERKIYIGNLQKKNKDLVKSMNECFIEARRLFFVNNELSDDDILSIKKDAIFCLRYCSNTNFGDNIGFREKNVYSSYCNIGKCEMYYNSRNMDIKGINSELLQYHENYMLRFIQTCFRHFETSTQETILRFMRRFIDDYKQLNLDIGYYRQFDINSQFILKEDDGMFYDMYWDDKKEELDISYNYNNIIIPLLNIAI